MTSHQHLRRSLPSGGSSSGFSPVSSMKKTATVAPLQSSAQMPFQSAKLQTKHSTWTPIQHKPSNEQLYTERRELIGHWFDLWTDLQRKRFLRYILGRCKQNQINFLNKFFTDNIPVTHADFTSYLPRFLSLRIFSFLDPRSLSRASMVCWHWKFLTDQDTIWMPKCIRQGWFLPYTPKLNEYGSWKLHYIRCLQSLDVAHPTNKTEMYGRLSDGSRYLTEEERLRRQRALKLRNADKNATLIWRERPPWLDPDPKPEDLAKSYNCLVASANPKIDPTRSRGHLRSFTEPSEVKVRYGLGSSRRRSYHRSTTEGELDMPRRSLSKAIAEEEYIDRGDALDQAWESPKHKLYSRGLSSGYVDQFAVMDTLLSSSKRNGELKSSTRDTRLVLLASNVPAHEILYASLQPDVKCVCYDYQSTTIDALQVQVEDTLKGLQAKSIAVITRGLDEVHLVASVSLSKDSLEKPELKHFFEVLSTLLLPRSEGAHLDFFAPLAATERGTELEALLSRVTGVPVSSPDVVGSDPLILVCNGVWSSTPEKGIIPAFLYFEESKLRLWQAEALRSLEAIKVCRHNMERFYKNKMNSRLIRATGEAVLESLLQQQKEDVVDKLIPALRKAVEALNQQEREAVEPVQFVADYLTAMVARDLKHASTSKEEDDLGLTSDLNSTSQQLLQVNTLKDQLILQPMDRRSCFNQIVSSEEDFVQVLDVLHDVYAEKLRASLNSNKAITSLPNIELMFADAGTLRKIHRPFYEELHTRLAEWNTQQCIGDCFIKLQSKLKAYTNFHNNYPVILATIDKCREQEPSFRSFLKRHCQTKETRMLTLQELFLKISTRIKDYIRLLIHQEHCTPLDHVDRKDIATAVETFKDLHDRIEQNQRRGESERCLRALQNRIEGCPTLFEANRHLIKEEHVTHLRLQQSDRADAGPLQHIQNLCLFVFNDALMVTVESKTHIPYTREVSTTLHFQGAVSLNKLAVQDIPDSRYASNMFSLRTPKRQWLCSLPTHIAKLSWISLLEETIRTAMDLDQ